MLTVLTVTIFQHVVKTAVISKHVDFVGTTQRKEEAVSVFLDIKFSIHRYTKLDE